MKTKEQVKKYNKEYFARPEVIERAKIRNAQYRQRRRLYKKSEAGKVAEQKYQSKPETKARIEWNRIRNRYGITKEQFEEILAQQEYKCAICFAKPEKRLHIDHCHKTSKVRGLLCGSCNRALGLLKDNTEFLYKAIEYLNV